MVDRFPQMLLNKYGKTPPKLLVLLGSMSMIFREEIKEMWGRRVYFSMRFRPIHIYRRILQKTRCDNS